MPKLGDILDEELLQQMLREGYVRLQYHPSFPYIIYNYTERAAYEGVWNDATLKCRGLIVNNETKDVIARPFKKFFNYGQTGAPTIELDAPVVVTDKMDGSLGILYPEPYSGKWAVATRGSFSSDQALHATQVWKDRYEGKFEPIAGFTFLFEIIYPENRIVLKYDYDDLVLLGAVDIATGISIPKVADWCEWPGKSAQVFTYSTFADALAAEPRSNAEGLVVQVLDTDERIKIKQEDYVALHRIVTGLNERTVWQHMVDDKPLEDLITPLPDEFHPWVQEVAARIDKEVKEQNLAIHSEFSDLERRLPQGYTRGDFARVATQSPNKWALFNILDDKPIYTELLKRAKPDPNVTPATLQHSEDTA